MRVSVVEDPRAPGGHEEQKGGSAGGVTIPLLQGAALLPVQMAAGDQIPEEHTDKAQSQHASLLLVVHTA